jgi:multidrug resistance efflux pump
VLFTLDSREYDAQLKQVKAQLAKAEVDLAQVRDRTNVDVV